MNKNKKNPYAPADGTELSLWNIVQLLLKKFYWLLLAGIVAAAGVYAVLTLLVTPTYESKVSFYVYNSANNTQQAGTINNSDLQAAESLATTYSKILESNSVLDAVLEDLNAAGRLSRKELSRMIEVSVVSNTQLLEVVVTSTDAQFACRIADSFGKVAPTEIVRITKAGGVEVVDHPEVAMEKERLRGRSLTAHSDLLWAQSYASLILSYCGALSHTTIYLPEDVETPRAVSPNWDEIPDINVTDKNYTYWELTEGGTARNAAEENKQ